MSFVPAPRLLFLSTTVVLTSALLYSLLQKPSDPTIGNELNDMSTMKAWQYTSGAGGLAKNLKLLYEASKPPMTKDQTLVEVISMSVNPVDYKIPELPIAKAMISLPATPGMDFVGRVSATGSDVSDLKVGQLIFGAHAKTPKYGALGQFTVVNKGEYASLPEGVSPDDAATIGVAGRTAYQALKPNVKAGDKVFINGGSGGTGTFAIQIAKAFGCHVTASCSDKNVELLKSLGADEVLDYKSVNVSKKLQEKGEVYNFVFDTVGTPADLYTAANKFLKQDGKFVQIGASPGLAAIKTIASRKLIPGFLGGGTRIYDFSSLKTSPEDLAAVAALVKEGKVKPVIDSTFEYEDAPKAFEKLKTGRARGKIVVHVAEPEKK